MPGFVGGVATPTHPDNIILAITPNAPGGTDVSANGFGHPWRGTGLPVTPRANKNGRMPAGHFPRGLARTPEWKIRL